MVPSMVWGHCIASATGETRKQRLATEEQPRTQNEYADVKEMLIHPCEKKATVERRLDVIGDDRIELTAQAWHQEDINRA